MTHTSTEQERKLFEAFASDNGKWLKSIERDAKGNYLLLTTAAGWMWWQAARQAPVVPHGWKLVPVELLERIQESLGSFVSDHGWGQADMDAFDDLSALAAAPQPPEAAPVRLPEPVAFALEWTFNGEERGMRLYDDETHFRFDAESDGGVCHPLYTEQQVRELLNAAEAENGK